MMLQNTYCNNTISSFVVIIFFLNAEISKITWLNCQKPRKLTATNVKILEVVYKVYNIFDSLLSY
jgi:hypothetical protein